MPKLCHEFRCKFALDYLGVRVVILKRLQRFVKIFCLLYGIISPEQNLLARIDNDATVGVSRAPQSHAGMAG